MSSRASRKAMERSHRRYTRVICQLSSADGSRQTHLPRLTSHFELLPMPRSVRSIHGSALARLPLRRGQRLRLPAPSGGLHHRVRSRRTRLPSSMAERCQLRRSPSAYGPGEGAYHGKHLACRDWYMLWKLLHALKRRGKRMRYGGEQGVTGELAWIAGWAIGTADWLIRQPHTS